MFRRLRTTAVLVAKRHPIIAACLVIGWLYLAVMAASSDDWSHGWRLPVSLVLLVGLLMLGLPVEEKTN
jgi:hypothetical protein